MPSYSHGPASSAAAVADRARRSRRSACGDIDPTEPVVPDGQPGVVGSPSGVVMPW